MANKIEYSFVQKENNHNLSFQSTTNVSGSSFTSEKNLTSFYTSFSDKAFFDSGLLPVDGSGLLSIRSAGPHTQIGYQHKPGMYYINWGGYEGDPRAAKIYVAQPYRIVIADIYNGNILGARTFYSPIPITYPNAPLYHVNLPNINCLGYRGNGVGWICLYHNEDISHYPFNEKVAKILDRCSGTEAYNDANMSETDGPRIYRKYNKPSYLHNPQEWQSYSEQNGFEWTLDQDLWIPILVTSLDEQGFHDENGTPLTYGMAVTGDYQAYYTDPIRPKPVNLISRSDQNLNEQEIFNWFKQSYNSASEEVIIKDNSFDAAEKIRNEQSLAAPVFKASEVDFVCACCGSSYTEDDDMPQIEIYGNDVVCQSCMDNGNLCHVEHIGDFVMDNHPNLVWLEHTEQYYLTNQWPHKISCAKCKKSYPFDKVNGFSHHGINYYHNTKLVYDEDDLFASQPLICINCIAIEKEELVQCAKCWEMVPKDPVEYEFHTLNIHHKNEDGTISLSQTPVCNYCYYYNSSIQEQNSSITESHSANCLCGEELLVKDFKELYFMNPHSHTKYSPSLNAALSNILDDLDSSTYMEHINSMYTSAIAGENNFISNYHQFKLENKILEFADPHQTPPSTISDSAIHVSVSMVCASCVDDLKDHWANKSPVSNWFAKSFMKNKFTQTLLDPQKLKNLYGTKITLH